jgi:hypothetical protein
MQAMPDARQQSFEEIYGPPENFLEIEVTLYFALFANFHWLYSSTDISTPGQEPTDPRLLPTDHVHILRDPHTHQHPRF